jgi:glycosyltransferase involved in cell wall biosynthesis
MTTPFFSIVLPTKNRSHIVGTAIQCALNQTFEDFELVVSDNSDDETTRAVVDTFSDPRLRYFRTGGLTMADNWEAGVRQARGEYVTIVEDKQMLYRRALSTVFAAVEKDRPQSAYWYVDMINNTDAHACVFSNLHGRRQPTTEYLTSMDVLNNLLAKGHYDAPYELPKGFNSCTHRSLIEQIRSGPGGRLCSPVTPDYTMGYAQVAYVDCVLRINEALSVIAWAGGTGVTYTLKVSNGAGHRFTAEVGQENFYDRVPIKVHTVINVFFNDFMRMRELIGKELNEARFEIVTYFTLCFDEIVRREKMGVDMSVEENAWKAALEQQPDEVRQSVRVAVQRYQRERAQHQRDQVLRKIGVTRVIGKIQQIISTTAPPPLHWPQTFDGVLAALEWEARGDYIGVLSASQN